MFVDSEAATAPLASQACQRLWLDFRPSTLASIAHVSTIHGFPGGPVAVPASDHDSESVSFHEVLAPVRYERI